MNINNWKIYLGIIVYFTLSTTVYAEEECDVSHGKNSIIFFGYTKHIVNDSRNKEGYMELFGYSRELCYGKFIFDTGVSTFVDSYDVRSYALFSNVSYEGLRYKILTPMIEIGVTNKGKDYDSDDRQTYGFIIPKIRVGAQKGLFADISGLPQIGQVTNGWVALEVGYKW